MFAERPYEQVWIEEVAEQAGVSRGLLYYYFPTKRAFFAAMLRRESARMQELTAPRPGLGLIEQLSGSVDAYLKYCQDHSRGMRMIYNGAESADPEIRAIVEDGIATNLDRMVAILTPDEPPSPLLLIALRSWLMFLRAACYGWLDAPGVPRAEVRELCTSTLINCLHALPEGARPAVLPGPA